MQKLRKQVDFEWVEGHKDPYNKLVDKRAKEAARTPSKPARYVESVRRKLSSESTDIKSVPMNGQRQTIRIVSSKYMNVQQVHKYRFEVVTVRSGYFGKISFLYSRQPMATGHWYYVQLNRG